MRKVLADDGTGVSKAAAVYYEDMYVDFDAFMKVTNTWWHSSLGDDGANIFDKILGMAKGSDGTPS